MEEIINNLIIETYTLKKSNFKEGSVDTLIKLWCQFSRCYGIFKLEEYKFNNPPEKSIILNGLLKDFETIKDKFNNNQHAYINFGLIYNHLLQLKK